MLSSGYSCREFSIKLNENFPRNPPRITLNNPLGTPSENALKALPAIYLKNFPENSLGITAMIYLLIPPRISQGIVPWIFQKKKKKFHKNLSLQGFNLEGFV